MPHLALPERLWRGTCSLGIQTDLCISRVTPIHLFLLWLPRSVWAVSLLPLLPHFEVSSLQSAEYKHWSMVYMALIATVPP